MMHIENNAFAESKQTGQGVAIQPAIWPEAGISTEAKPYIQISGPAGLSLDRGGVVAALGGMISSDSYFNLFNLGKWRDLCGDLPIELWLEGRGRFHLTVWSVAPHRSFQRLYSDTVSVEGGLRLPLDLGSEGGQSLLFFEMVSLGEGRLDDFAWATTAPPRQTPDLALCVTTFRREAAVAVTLQRFRAFRAGLPQRDHLHLFLVDNGQTITESSGDGVTIIPNANLGGAGGFTRGFLEAREASYTHCLFMDDDASIHMGSILRSWMFLAYARHPDVAVAGAMINADHCWQIWENGAVFDRGCRPQFFGLDMRERDRVFQMEFRTTGSLPDGYYAGWWFFAFPIRTVKHLAFPFFVRGDDVSFSLANEFRTVMLPGVASFQESFTDKASPQTWYLDMRSHLAHHLSLPSKQVSWFRLQRMFFSFYLRTVLRYHYDSLAAVNLAIEDVLRGPQFFADHADMAIRRADLKEITKTEIWQPIDRTPDKRRGQSSRPLRALLLASLNGHLLPFSNLLGTDLVIDAPHRHNFREIYGARRITYLNAQETACYTVTRQRGRFLKESWRMLKNSLRLRASYGRQRKVWQDSYAELTAEPFWRRKLDLPPAGSGGDQKDTGRDPGHALS
ncbi:hypothetical protein [Paracoccus sp. (in: a-proteobacteria)]|uniref:hypothetical protein n=1 Tax=Paracoccus sp. TaxID=267 RepID=UPI004057D4FF